MNIGLYSSFIQGLSDIKFPCSLRSLPLSWKTEKAVIDSKDMWPHLWRWQEAGLLYLMATFIFTRPVAGRARCSAGFQRAWPKGPWTPCLFHLQLIASQIRKHLLHLYGKNTLKSLSYGGLNKNSQTRDPSKASACKAVFAKTRYFKFHAKHNLHFQDCRNCDRSFEDLFNLMKITDRCCGRDATLLFLWKQR